MHETERSLGERLLMRLFPHTIANIRNRAYKLGRADERKIIDIVVRHYTGPIEND